jgi:hypothetical protein
MNRNDLLHWFILGFGQTADSDDLGRTTNMLQLWQEAKGICFDCGTNEVLDALYTLPREHAALIKLVPAGDGVHPVSFDRVRNTIDWPEYFTGEFSVKVLPEGEAYYREITQQLELPRRLDSLRALATVARVVDGHVEA